MEGIAPNRKAVSPFIEMVFTILFGVTMLAIILNTVNPLFNRATDTSAVNDAFQNLELLRSAVESVASEAQGSTRTVPLSVSGGTYRVNATYDWLYFEYDPQEALQLFGQRGNVLVRQGFQFGDWFDSYATGSASSAGWTNVSGIWTFSDYKYVGTNGTSYHNISGPLTNWKFSASISNVSGATGGQVFALPTNPESLVGYWTMDEAAGGTTYDYSRNANNGTIYARHENLIKYSQDYSNAVWGGYCGSKTNIITNTTDITAPDGTYTTGKWTLPANISCGNSTSWGVLQTASPAITNNTIYTVSVWSRGASGGESFYLGISDYNQCSFTLTTSWKRYTCTKTITVVTRGLQFFSTTANAVYYAWGAQLEKQSNAGLYTATAGTIVNDGTIAYAGQFPSPWKTGKYASALQFDGVDNYVNITNTQALSLANTGFTLSAWIYPTNITDSFQGVISKGVANSAGWQYIYVGTSQTIKLWLSNGTAYDYLASSNKAPLNTWTYGTIVYNYNANNPNLSNVSFYFNGVYDKTIDTTFIASSTIDLKFGWTASGWNRYFNGTIDEVMIFNRSLSANEVAALYETSTKKISGAGGSQSITSKVTNPAIVLSVPFGQTRFDNVEVTDGTNRLTFVVPFSDADINGTMRAGKGDHIIEVRNMGVSATTGRPVVQLTAS